MAPVDRLISRLRPLAAAAATAIALVAIAPQAGHAATDPTATGGSTADALARVNDYFNGIRTMSGDFVQFGPTGRRAEGSFVIARPGKVRFQYDPPAKLDIVADGKSVVVRDKRRATQDVWPLSKTPLRFLLADKIDLTRDAKVTNVSVDGDMITVTIQESTVFGDGKLTLLFDAKTTELKQWTVTDAQGLDTTVAIYNLRTGVAANPKLFEVDYLQGIGRNR
jgi:outer membrane lipoprotein-sorting protein